MIVLNRDPTINKVPNYQNEKYGKIQISSKELARYVGNKMHVQIHIFEHNEINILDTMIVAK